MKKSLALAALCLSPLVVLAIPTHDPFNYTVAGLITNQVPTDGGAWFRAATDASLGNQPTIVSGNLSYSGLPASTGNSMQVPGGGGGGFHARFQTGGAIGGAFAGSFFYSFIFSITDLTGLSTTGASVVGFNNSGGSQNTTPVVVAARLVLKTNTAAGGYLIGLNKGSGTTADFVFDSTGYNLSDTVFVVARYKFNTASTTDDEVRLWINPSSGTFGGAEPSTSTLTNTTTTEADITSAVIASVLFINNASGPATMIVDEFRVGTNWAEVTADANVGTLVKHDPSGLSGQPASFGSNYVDANVVASAVSRGSNAFVPAGTGGAFNSSNFTNTTAGGSMTSSNFTTFLIAPKANYIMTFTGLSSFVSRSGTGPTNAGWFYGGDNFASALVSSTAVTTANTNPTALATPLSIANVTSATEFRLGAGGASSSGGTMRIGNAFAVRLSGTATNRTAGTLTWDGGGTSDNWDAYSALAANQGNWDLNKVPTSSLVDSLAFAGSTRLTPNNNVSGVTANSITFNGGAGAFTVGGNAVTVNDGITNNSSNAQTINNNLTLGGAQTWDAANGNLVIGGNATNGSATLTVRGANNTAVSGIIGNGSGGLTKAEGGTLTLSGANTYTGNTMIDAGALNLSGSIAGSATAAAGGTLKGIGSVAGSVDVNGTVSPGASVGTLSTGALLLESGGTNAMEIIDAAGSAGTGYDTIAVSSDIGVLSTSGSKFTIKLLSLNGAGSAGGVTNFNNDTSYTWTSASGNVTNFAADKLQVDTSSFNNDVAGGEFVVEPGSLLVRFTNNHAPTASAAGYSFAKGVSIKNFQIPIASFLAANTGDPDNDGRDLVSVSSTNATASTNVTDISISSTNGIAESIQYVVRDARTYRLGDTVRTATNYIHILRTNAVGSLTITNSGGGSLTMSFYGIPGYQYVIQRSCLDLSSWVDVVTNTAPTGGSNVGLIEYTETPPGLCNPAFYRMRQE